MRRPHRLRYSLIILCLVANISWSDPRIAVSPVRDGVSDLASEQLAAVMRETLGKLGVVVVPQAAMQVIEQYQQAITVSPTGDTAPEAITAQLATAKRNFLNFQNAAAEQAIAAIETQFRTTPTLVAMRGHIFAEALLLRALMQHACRNPAGMQQTLAALQTMTPNFSVRSPDYPPSLVQAWEARRSHHLTGALAVESTPPAAEVRLNGITIGITPLANITVPAGEYQVAIIANRYAPIVRAVHIQPHKTARVKVRLQWQRNNTESPHITKQHVDDNVAQLVAAQRIGQLTRSERVIAIDVDEPTRRRGVVTARMIDPALGVSMAPQVIRYGDNRARLPQRLADLAQRMVKLSRIDLQQYPGRAVEPREISNPEYLAQRTTARRERRLRPAIWAVVGTAVVGGIIGGVLAATSHGPNTGGLLVRF